MIIASSLPLNLGGGLEILKFLVRGGFVPNEFGRGGLRCRGGSCYVGVGSTRHPLSFPFLVPQPIPTADIAPDVFQDKE